MSDQEQWNTWPFIIQAFLAFIILAGFPYAALKNNSWDTLTTHWWMFIFLALWAIGWFFYVRWLILTFKNTTK